MSEANRELQLIFQLLGGLGPVEDVLDGKPYRRPDLPETVPVSEIRDLLKSEWFTLVDQLRTEGQQMLAGFVAAGELGLAQETLRSNEDFEHKAEAGLRYLDSDEATKQIIEKWEQLCQVRPSSPMTIVYSDLPKFDEFAHNWPQIPKLKPLTDRQQEVFELIQTHRLIAGKKLAKLAGMEESTLTTHIIPVLKKTRGVRNKRGAGYYIE